MGRGPCPACWPSDIWGAGSGQRWKCTGACLISPLEHVQRMCSFACRRWLDRAELRNCRWADSCVFRELPGSPHNMRVMLSRGHERFLMGLQSSSIADVGLLLFP